MTATAQTLERLLTINQGHKEYWNTHDAYEETVSKICHVCKVLKSSGEFYKHATSKDGLQARCKECMRLANAKNFVKRMVIAARTRAQRSGAEFSISEQDIVVPSACPILGIPLSVGIGRQHNGSPSLDRVNNSKGYTPGNIRVISWRANNIKHDATIEELEKVLTYMKTERNTSNL